MGMRSHNFDGLPVLAGMMMVIPNMAIHTLVIQLILSRLDFHWHGALLLHKLWGRIFYLVFFSFIYLYYWYKGRYKRIIEKYNSGKDTYWKKHPFVTIVLFTVVDLILFCLALIIDKYIIPIWFENRNPVLILKLLILLSTHEVLVFLRTKGLNMKNMWMENETARDIKYRTINQGDMKPETAYKFIKRFTLTNTQQSWLYFL